MRSGINAMEKSRRDCASLLKEERDDRENRVEDERRDRKGAIGIGRAAHERVACLNQNQRRNENNDADSPRDRVIAFQIEHRTEKKNRDLQYKFDRSMIPKTEADLYRVVIDGEIGTMNHQIEKPMRKNRETHQQRRAVRGNVVPADFVNHKRYRRPEESADEAVRVRHVIKIERISRCDSGNETHLLDAEQNKWRPQKIQQLHCHEQDPERDLISRRFDRKRDAVMADEHQLFSLNTAARLSTLQFCSLTPSSLKFVRLLFSLDPALVTLVARPARSVSGDSAKRIDLPVSADYGSPTQVSEHPASQPVRRQ